MLRIEDHTTHKQAFMLYKNALIWKVSSIIEASHDKLKIIFFYQSQES